MSRETRDVSRVSQAIAYRLATCRLCLRRLRRRIVERRARAPLFDVRAWLAAWQRALAALADVPQLPAPQGEGRVAGRAWSLVVADLSFDSEAEAET